MPTCTFHGSVSLLWLDTLATAHIKDPKLTPGGDIIIGWTHAGISIGGIKFKICVNPILELTCIADCQCPGIRMRHLWRTRITMPEICKELGLGIAWGKAIPNIWKLKAFKIVAQAIIEFIESGVIDMAATMAAIMELVGEDKFREWIDSAVEALMAAMRLILDTICKSQFEAMLLSGLNPCPDPEEFLAPVLH